MTSISFTCIIDLTNYTQVFRNTHLLSLSKMADLNVAKIWTIIKVCATVRIYP